MLFSIIVPVYNIGEWISQCVESILAQTFQDYELILVDDGSTDQSGVICDNYAKRNQNIQVIHKKNGGPSDARNWGVERAVGEYIFFVDGDDYIADRTLEDLYQILKDKKPDVILSEGIYHVSNGEIILKQYYEKENFDGISGETALSSILRIKNNWSAWGKCFRNDYWKGHRFRFEPKRLAEDFQLIYKVIMDAESVYMIPAFYYYQVREDSIMHTIDSRMIVDMLENFSDWEEYLAGRNINKVLKEQMYAGFAHELCYLVMTYMYLTDVYNRDDLIRQASRFKYFLRYNRTSECNMIRMSVKLLGMKATCRLLGIIKRFRMGR